MHDRLYFINVNFANITAKGNIYNTFDFDLVQDMYEKCDEDNVPIVYNFMYQYLTRLSPERIPITYSPDPAISVATAAALAEKFIQTDVENDVVRYKSSLKIIYLTPTPHIVTDIQRMNVENLTHSIIANLVCKTKRTITRHKLSLSENQFILIGLNPNFINDFNKEELDKSNMTYFTLEQMKKKGIKKVMTYIQEIVGDDPIHVIFDMSVMSHDVTPCVTRFVDIYTETHKLTGININDLTEILSSIPKNNLVGLDVVGYDFRIPDVERAHRITCETAKLPLKYLLGIKEKKINIFNENSKILIWRPLRMMSDADIGWLILRGISLEIREKIIDMIGDDNIIIFPITNDQGMEENVYISTTTMAEQETKLYYDSDQSIHECILFPDEKVNMMFDMLNTNENALHIEESVDNANVSENIAQTT